MKNNQGAFYPISGYAQQNDYDAFGRTRISSPSIVFDNSNQYGVNTIFWDQVTSGTATITHAPNESVINLTVSALNDVAANQSRRYHYYQPGKSQYILNTSVLNPVTNVIQRVGYFDDQNGLFLEANSGTINFVLRSNVTGSVVETRIPQNTWNVDKFDGTGPSSLTLNFSTANLFFIDFEWLGVGKIRFGFYANGVPKIAHEILNINSLSTTYMTTATLPIRYENRAIGTLTTPITLKQICSSVMTEGGVDTYKALNFSVANTTSPSVTTRRPILTIRPRSTFNGITNRVQMTPETYSISAKTNDLYYEIVLNGTLASGTTWQNVNTSYSVAEYDIASTSITGGIVLDSGFVSSSQGAFSTSIEGRVSQAVGLARNINNTSGDIVSIVITSMANTTNPNASINWKELK